MKQILQNLKTGETKLADIPSPHCKSGHLLIHTSTSLVSAGTERMLVDFGKANLLQKARQQPDKVRMVLDKMKTDGILPTIEAVKNKLDQSLPMGYCNVGRIVAVGPGLESEGYKIGERMASNGNHAEVACVPHILCTRVPDSISDEAASFTVLGAIALQGVRLIQPTIGEAIVVTGLGLVGLLTVQLLKAHGCRVLGIDFDCVRCGLARQFGAEAVDLSKGEDPLLAAERFSRGRGVDGVLITAATKSNEPVHWAATMCRQRGRIVLVGVVGLELSRADFFKKELSFQVSCSYGPGRYDPEYEDKGHDYPFGFVRWTEQRNFEAVMDLLSEGKIDVKPLISHRFAFRDAVMAYELVRSKQPSLGILLEYSRQCERGQELGKTTIPLKTPEMSKIRTVESPSAAFIGAGNYANAVLIPAFCKTRIHLKTIASSGGVSGTHAAKKYGFEFSTTDTESIFADDAVNTVVITTRHNSHAKFILKSLQAGKHVFVEKPLCLTLDELNEIQAAYSAGSTRGSSVPLLMVGFNRRFAPQVQKMKELLAGVTEPKSFVMTVNAGAIPSNHWTQDPEVGGGRIIGEACHFIDLLRFLSDNVITSRSRTAKDSANNDTVSLQLGFADGSIGTVHYFANGSKSFPKERLEVFAAGGVLQLDNFRKLRGFAWPGFSKMNLWRQDKGQAACARAFVDALQNGGVSPIPFEEIVEVSRLSIELAAL